MTVRDRFDHMPAKPVPKFNDPFLVTGRAEMAALAGVRKQILMAAFRAADAAKSVG
jgi:hypothetical protein